MHSISKYFLVGALMLMLTTLVPSQNMEAQIFEGTQTGEGKVGICLGDPDLKKYPECAGIDCDKKENSENIMCQNEAQAGTEIAGDSLGSTGITHTDNFSDFIKKLINFFLPYLTLAAFLGYVVAGFMYVTAFGNEEQTGKAKKILIWSSIGLVLVIFSFAITQLFTQQLVEGLNDASNQGTPDLNQLKNK